MGYLLKASTNNDEGPSPIRCQPQLEWNEEKVVAKV